MKKFLPGAALLLFNSCLVSIASESEPSLKPTAVVLHIGPAGRDNWSGLLEKPNPSASDGPLASLEGARNTIRKMRGDGRLSGQVTVQIAAGTYPLHTPVTFLPEDSGTANAPVVYRAAPGARPVFSGGRTVPNLKKGPEAWTAELSEVKSGQWRFEQLWINGRREVRARMPDAVPFFLMTAKADEEVLEPATEGSRAQKARQTIHAKAHDLRLLRGMEEKQIRNAQLVIYHKWDITRRSITSVDAENAKITTEGFGMKPWNLWNETSGFVIENIPAALNIPGEWFLGEDGTFKYLPRKDEIFETSQVIAPVTDKFLVFQGTPEEGQFVQHLSFQGLTFKYGNWTMPPEGFDPDRQAAVTIGAVVEADGARQLSFENCEIAHIGTYAFWFRKGCSDISVQNCYLHDLGAGGIRIGEGGARSREVLDRTNPAEHTHHVNVQNNIIESAGHIFPCAVGVWIGDSGNNTVRNNEISDLFYTAISAGWTWGYHDSKAKNNDISFNYIHHIGKGILSDMGAIYTLGPSSGTVISNNIIHDIDSFTYGGWGIYTDEGSSDITIENNLVYNTKSGGFHQHYGRDNVVRNNIFAFGREYQIARTRPEEHISFAFTKNIIYWDRGKLFGGHWEDSNFVMEDNIYWKASAQTPDFSGKTFEDWQTGGHDKGSRLEDPLFENAAQRNFRLKPNSPVAAFGFRPFDFSECGVRNIPEWMKLSLERSRKTERRANDTTALARFLPPDVRADGAIQITGADLHLKMGKEGEPWAEFVYDETLGRHVVRLAGNHRNWAIQGQLAQAGMDFGKSYSVYVVAKLELNLDASIEYEDVVMTGAPYPGGEKPALIKFEDFSDGYTPLYFGEFHNLAKASYFYLAPCPPPEGEEPNRVSAILVDRIIMVTNQE